jgi:hypothetical protein
MTKRKPNPLPVGRPRKGNERHTVSLPETRWQFVATFAGDNRSARLDTALRMLEERLADERYELEAWQAMVSLPPALWAHVDAQAGDNRSERLRVVVQAHQALDWLLRMVGDRGWVDPPLPVGVELDPAYMEIAKRRVGEALAKEGE